jgi:hypothetical protein
VSSGTVETSRALAPPGRTVDRLVVAALVTTAAVAAIGLLAAGAYRGPASLAWMLKGYDAVTLAAVVMAGPWVVRSARRGSTWGWLGELSLLAYLVYMYAFYVFAAPFNDWFLAHVAVFGLSTAALVAGLGSVDARGLAERFDPRAPVRVVAVVLGSLGVALAGMWVVASLRFAVTGDLPEGSALVETPSVVHLGIALDLGLLAPWYVLASVLLWRRAPWGFVLAALALLSGILHQVGYLVAMPFQVAGDVPGAAYLDPFEPVIVGLYGLSTFLLLRRVRS